MPDDTPTTITDKIRDLAYNTADFCRRTVKGFGDNRVSTYRDAVSTILWQAVKEEGENAVLNLKFNDITYASLYDAARIALDDAPKRPALKPRRGGKHVSSLRDAGSALKKNAREDR